MAKKKASVKKSLVQAKEAASSAILSHPVFRDMAGRLETMQKMLQSLPQAIGQAVAEATRQAPAGASGPAIPLVDAKEVEIGLRKLSVDGKLFSVNLVPPKQVCVERMPLTPGGPEATVIARVLKLSKSDVTLQPIEEDPGLGAHERVWSLETWQRKSPIEPDDSWSISVAYRQLLLKCAVEIPG